MANNEKLIWDGKFILEGIGESFGAKCVYARGIEKGAHTIAFSYDLLSQREIDEAEVADKR